MTPATMAATLGPLSDELESGLLLPFVPPVLPEVSVAVAPSDVTVYVTGLPVASGPSVAVTTGAVIVAPPLRSPPMTLMTASGTW